MSASHRHLSRHLSAIAAMFAIVLALPVVALPTPAVAKTQMKTAMDCGGACPMMAAQRRSGHSGMGHAMDSMAGGSCAETMGFDCCAAAPAQPSVPLGEATPASTVSVPAPPATPVATLPLPTSRAALAAPSADGPDPPAAPLFLLHGSFLS